MSASEGKGASTTIDLESALSQKQTWLRPDWARLRSKCGDKFPLGCPHGAALVLRHAGPTRTFERAFEVVEVVVLRPEPFDRRELPALQAR